MNTAPMLATDEDIAIRVPSDYGLLAPSDQLLASGEDGSIRPGEPWFFDAASTDFERAGVCQGHMVLLKYLAETQGYLQELYAIDGVSQGTLCLRRKGEVEGVGQPPRSLINAARVAFTIPTLQPQIQVASEEILLRLGASTQDLNPSSAGGREILSILRSSIVALVLSRRYADLSARVQEPNGDTFGSKSEFFRRELDDFLELGFRKINRDAGSDPARMGKWTRLSR